MSSGVPAPAREHLAQVDVIRIMPMAGVVAVHSLIFTQPSESVGANAALMLLHANREIFFFVTAFLLFHSTRGRGAGTSPRRFWRRRYPLVVAPYLAWTGIYWLQTQHGVPWPPVPALRLLGVDLALGWFHLYFLLVTMQLYALFPLLAWLIRRTRGRHWWLLGASAVVQVLFTALFEYGGPAVPWALRAWFANAQVEVTSYQLAFVAGALAADHVGECLAWVRGHGRIALTAAAAAALAAEAWYALNLALGRSAQQAADVFQPAALLAVGAAVVALVVLADHLARTRPPDGRLWRGVRAASRASFGVYLSHMLPLQLLLLTPLAALVHVNALPLPVRAPVVLALVLAAAFALVTVAQRTALSLVLTGRPRRMPRAGPETRAERPAPPEAAAVRLG